MTAQLEYIRRICNDQKNTHFNEYLCFMQIEIFDHNVCSPANVSLI